MLAATAIAVIAGVASVAVVRQSRDEALRAGNTPFFEWSPGPIGTGLVLQVHPNATASGIASLPVVPENGSARIVGRPGTAQPGAIVQVLNTRDNRAAAVTAAQDGSFELRLDARQGDQLQMLMMMPPRIQRSEAAIAPSE